MTHLESRKFLLIACVGFPTALSLWIGNVLLASLFQIENISIFRWFSSVFIPLLFIYWGLKKNSLSLSGCIAGYFVGFIITLSNFIFLSCLATFFVTSSKLTKFRSHMKQKLEEHFVEGGKRNWIQVLSNGIVGSIIAFIYILDCGAQEQILDVRNKYRCTLIAYSFLGAFACSNGDTWASEVGPVMMYGANPFLITTFKRVPKGTNGGVSIAGLLASFMGGATVGLSYFVTLLLTVSSNEMRNAPPQWPVILFGGLAGFLGSLIDSFMGATIQYSGRNKEGRIVEHPGIGVKHISGRHIFDNHGVNLLSTIFTSFLMPYIVLLFY
ncbi:UNVERIFIED_CONTAM: hypothetical protein RMT77_017744 [Armadillidium vulgare]